MRYALEFEKGWQAHERPVGDSWRCDETYLKVHGHWCYLYRATDLAGAPTDFLFSVLRRRNCQPLPRSFILAFRAGKWCAEEDP